MVSSRRILHNPFEVHPITGGMHWKGGKVRKNGYILSYAPGHRRAYNKRYVFEHILVFERYHECCVLPWGDVHHKNGRRDDNAVSNLQGMMHGRHKTLHLLKKRDDRGRRICMDCGSRKTRVRIRSNRPTPTEEWEIVDRERKLFRCRMCAKTARRKERVALGLPRDGVRRSPSNLTPST